MTGAEAVKLPKYTVLKKPGTMTSTRYVVLTDTDSGRRVLLYVGWGNTSVGQLYLASLGEDGLEIDHDTDFIFSLRQGKNGCVYHNHDGNEVLYDTDVLVPEPPGPPPAMPENADDIMAAMMFDARYRDWYEKYMAIAEQFRKQSEQK